VRIQNESYYSVKPFNVRLRTRAGRLKTKHWTGQEQTYLKNDLPMKSGESFSGSMQYTLPQTYQSNYVKTSSNLTNDEDNSLQHQLVISVPIQHIAFPHHVVASIPISIDAQFWKQ